VLVFILKAIPDTRIMTGGDDDGTTCLFRQNTKADDRCWRCLRAEIDFYAVAGNNLSRRGSKVLGGKTGIITDNQSPAS
jgi:hypothetical protein